MMFMTQTSSKGTCRQQSVHYRQWRLVSQSGDLFSHTKDEQNHVKTNEGPGDCDCVRHSEVCDWRLSVPNGTRYISLREIYGRLAGGMFQGDLALMSITHFSLQHANVVWMTAFLSMR